MIEHEPECWCRGCTHPHVCGRCRNCICDELRACKQRVLDAAREAVVGLKKYVDFPGAPVNYIHPDFFIAAIDALKEDNDQRSQAEGVEL